MPYLLVEDFQFGLDLRKGDLTAPPGTLRKLVNAHVNRGGELEKRKAMVAMPYDLTGTVGLTYLRGVAHVYGEAGRPATLHADVDFTSLPHPSGNNVPLAGILSTQWWAGQAYLVAEYADDTLVHFYDGRVVTLGAGLEFGRTAVTVDSKIYSASNSQFMFSPIDDPSRLGVAEDEGGFIDVSRITGRPEELRAVVVYRNEVAVMGDHTTLIYDVDPARAGITLTQRMENVGSVAPRTAQSYGNNDVFFLSRAGLQSLRASDSADFVRNVDVGDPIDTLLLEVVSQFTTEQLSRTAHAIVDPTDGRYWLSLGDRVFVFTAFGGSDVAAWSEYDFGFVLTDFASVEGRLYARSADRLYVYGGDDNKTYDASQVKVLTPFMSAQTPAHKKMWDALDVSCIGEWQVAIRAYANHPAVVEPLAWINQHTYPELSLPMRANTTHVAVELTSEHEGPAVLHNLSIHYELEHAD